MPLPQNLKQNLQRVLRTFKAANGISSVPDGAGKALEAWILMRLAKAAHSTKSWNVTLRQGDGTLLPINATFKFATSQVGIQAANVSAPSYVLLEHLVDKHKRLELHGGLQWRGRSTATHEIDVSALPALVAEALRNGKGGLPRGLPVLAVECKDITTSGTSDEMRQTLARMFDLALVTKPAPFIECRTYEDVTFVSWGSRSSTYRSFFSKGTFAVARVGQFQLGARQLANHYHIRRIGDAYSKGNASIKKLETHFVQTLNELDQL